MPRKPARKAPRCLHGHIQSDSSSIAVEQGFQRPPPEKRLAASTYSGRESKWGDYSTPHAIFNDAMTFPAPLVLPGDDLAHDPEYPPQSFKSWVSYNTSVPISSKRNAIYVVPPPEKTAKTRALMDGWSVPQVPEGEQTPNIPPGLSAPKAENISDYLGAFYHKMTIKTLDANFTWAEWPANKSKNKNAPTYIGLATPGPSRELVGIRYRPSPDGIAKQQLNLTDILDALMSVLPSDAYAIMMLVDEDLYEDEEDDFCCGRAYGASHISVVSSFRYNPSLDVYSEVDHQHMWPESHCQRYVSRLCGEPIKRAAKHGRTDELPIVTPLRAAIDAARRLDPPLSKDDYDALWFSRVGRTASHEVGHCFGLDHCVYFACVMQGTAGMGEDVRQPPYLCPVCLQKVSWAMTPLLGSGSMMTLMKAYIKERYAAIKVLSDNWKSASMFSGWGAWAEKRLEGIEVEEERGATAQP